MIHPEWTTPTITASADRDLAATLDEAWAVDDAPPVGPEPDGEERAWWWGVQHPPAPVPAGPGSEGKAER